MEFRLSDGLGPVGATEPRCVGVRTALQCWVEAVGRGIMSREGDMSTRPDERD